MKIQFLEDAELEIITRVIDDEPQTEREYFKKGDKTDFDICDDLEPPFAREIQFGDGSVAFVNENFWKNVEIE
jgi:hypothetical protein